MSASDDWITVGGFGGLSSPQTYALRPINSKAPDVAFEVAVDADNLSPATPGTYVGSVTFSSDDSGVPAFERTNEVVFDYCRQTSATTGVWIDQIAPGESGVQGLVATTDPPAGATVADIDTVIEDFVEVVGQGFAPSYQIALEAPNGASVLLKDYTDPQLVYYDEDRVTPSVLLDLVFEGLQTGPGSWQLRFTNNPLALDPIRVTLNRWEVRLHTNEAAACAQ